MNHFHVYPCDKVLHNQSNVLAKIVVDKTGVEHGPS